MRTVSLPVRLRVAASLAAATALAAKPPDFPQATRVHGKVPVDMSAAWFLYAQAQFPGDKTRALATGEDRSLTSAFQRNPRSRPFLFDPQCAIRANVRGTEMPGKILTRLECAAPVHSLTDA